MKSDVFLRHFRNQNLMSGNRTSDGVEVVGRIYEWSSKVMYREPPTKIRGTVTLACATQPLVGSPVKYYHVRADSVTFYGI